MFHFKLNIIDKFFFFNQCFFKLFIRNYSSQFENYHTFIHFIPLYHFILLYFIFRILIIIIITDGSLAIYTVNKKNKNIKFRQFFFNFRVQMFQVSMN